MPLVSSAPIHLSPMPTRHDADEPSVGLPRLWRWLSLAAAGLAGVGSILGFVAGDRIYGQETTSLTDTAAAQDAVNILLVVPLLIALGRSASRLSGMPDLHRVQLCDLRILDPLRTFGPRLGRGARTVDVRAHRGSGDVERTLRGLGTEAPSATGRIR